MRRLKRILLVDDEDVCNFVATAIIENLNIVEEILVAQNGKEALMHLLFKSKPVDIIFLDLNMPVMNGREFLKELYCLIPHGESNLKLLF